MGRGLSFDLSAPLHRHNRPIGWPLISGVGSQDGIWKPVGDYVDRATCILGAAVPRPS